MQASGFGSERIPPLFSELMVPDIGIETYGMNRRPIKLLCCLVVCCSVPSCGLTLPTLYQEQAVFGKMKMDPSKRAQSQNTSEVSSLEWSFPNPLN